MNTVHVSEASHAMIINVESDEDNFSTALATLNSQSAKNKENQKNSTNIARNMNSSNKQPPTVKKKTSVPSAGSHNNVTNAMDLTDADLVVRKFFSCGLQEIWNSVQKYAEKNKFEEADCGDSH